MFLYDGVKSKFIAQLNNSFGSGGMSLAFNDNQFSLFLQFLKKEAGRNLPIRKAVTVIGKQGNSSVWVLGRDLQLDAEGEVIPNPEQTYMWLDETINEALTMFGLEEVLPVISLPLGTTSGKWKRRRVTTIVPVLNFCQYLTQPKWEQGDNNCSGAELLPVSNSAHAEEEQADNYSSGADHLPVSNSAEVEEEQAGAEPLSVCNQADL